MGALEASPLASPRGENAPAEEVKAEAPEEEETAPLCCAVPAEYLHNLPQVLTRKTCTEKTYRSAMNVLRRVCANEENRSVLLGELSQASLALAEKLAAQLGEITFAVDGGALTMNQPDTTRSSLHGLSFLRLLKLVVALNEGNIADHFEELWKYLNVCMDELSTLFTEQQGLTIKDTTSFSSLIPVIEAFFVVHADSEPIKPVVLTTPTNSAPSTPRRSLSSSELHSSTSTATSFEPDLYAFIKRNKTLINLLVKQNP